MSAIVGASCRNAQQKRHDEPLAKFRREIVEHKVARRLDVGQKLLHQLVVIVREALQHGEARLARQFVHTSRELHDLARGVLAVDEGPLERQIDEARHDAVFPDRELAQYERRGRGGLQPFQHLAQAGVSLVDLVEEHETRHAQVLELLQDELQGRSFLLVGLRNDDRRVDGGEDRARLVEIFDRPGAVDEGVAVAEEVDRGDVGLDAHAMGARLGVVIAHRRPLAHAAGAIDRSGAQQYAFQQARLAAEIGTDDGDASRPGFIPAKLAHGPSSLVRTGLTGRRKRPGHEPASNAFDRLDLMVSANGAPRKTNRHVPLRDGHAYP